MNGCSASRSTKNLKPLQTSSVYFRTGVARLQLRSVATLPLQMNRRDDATCAPTAKLNRREFKRHDPRVAAQCFPLVFGQCADGTSGNHQQFLAPRIV